MSKLYLGVDDSDVAAYYDELKESKYVLISYFYAQNGKYDYQKLFDDVLVDSGAFSFMTSKKNVTKKEIEEYCDSYINYINKFNIKHYVELDLDSIFGYPYVLELRKRLEKGTGKKCIPIWHVSRGKEEYIKMCKEYEYAGVGGIASGEKLKEFKHVYKDLNLLAKKYNCKLHAMGFTPTKDLHQFGFYSTDSTSWKSGRRFGTLYRFSGNKLLTLKVPEGKRIKNYKKADILNIKEWIKYQSYVNRFNPI